MARGISRHGTGGQGAPGGLSRGPKRGWVSFAGKLVPSAVAWEGQVEQHKLQGEDQRKPVLYGQARDEAFSAAGGGDLPKHRRVEEEGSGDLGGRVRRAQSGPLEPESLGDIPGDVLQAGLDLLAPSPRPGCLRCCRRPIPDAGHNLARMRPPFTTW